MSLIIPYIILASRFVILPQYFFRKNIILVFLTHYAESKRYLENNQTQNRLRNNHNQTQTPFPLLPEGQAIIIGSGRYCNIKNQIAKRLYIVINHLNLFDLH